MIAVQKKPRTIPRGAFFYLMVQNIFSCQRRKTALSLPAPLAENAVVIYCPFAVSTYHRFNLPS